MSFLSWLFNLLGISHSTTTTTTIVYPTTTTTTTTGVPSMGNKKALCIGINNYPGTSNDLSGCVNDANDWATLLKSLYGFSDAKMLLDSQVTYDNVVREMTNLITTAKSGDVLVVTYSGHGSSVPDVNGDEEDDSKDECICLYDKFLIDDVIRDIFAKLPEGVKLSFLSDSCHSGTVTREFLRVMNDSSFISTPKYMPPPDNGRAIALSALDLNGDFGSPVRKDLSETTMNHVLVAGCKNTEYSYDASFNGRPNGAFTAMAIKVLRANPKVTWNQFYTSLSKLLPSNSYPQTPCLEGTEENKNMLVFQ